MDKKKPLPAKRTKEETFSFMKDLDEKHRKIKGVKAVSPLAFLDHFDIVNGFVPDYMHAILLGVAKQITNLLMWKDDDKEYYQNLLNLVKLPHQVCRLTRPIEDNKFWNARVWENWVLYISQILFSTRLADKYLKYWSLLVESLHILLKDEIKLEELDRAEKMLKKFVELTQTYFTPKAMTFNVHQLLHITDSVRNWGPLWAHSAFAFEAGNHNLLQAVHCGNGAVLQIIRFINISNKVSEMEKRLFKDESEIVKTYCNNTFTRRVQKCLKVGKRTYFGAGEEVNTDIKEQLSLSEDSVCFERMVHKGCLYISSLKDNQRSDDSVALLQDGTYVQIMSFIVDKLNKRELIQCRRINLETANIHYNCTHVKNVSQTENCNNELEFIETDQINRISVHYNIGDTEIVSAVPNSLYY